jgi:transposase-like protein
VQKEAVHIALGIRTDGTKENVILKIKRNAINSHSNLRF